MPTLQSPGYLLVVFRPELYTTRSVSGQFLPVLGAVALPSFRLSCPGASHLCVRLRRVITAPPCSPAGGTLVPGVMVGHHNSHDRGSLCRLHVAS